jgi:integrase
MMSQVSRVDGPYRDRAKWRLVIFQEGIRTSMIVDTEQEARAVKARLATMGTSEPTRTMEDGLHAYLEAMQAQGLRSNSIRQKAYLLKQFLPPELELHRVTVEEAQKLYVQETQRIGRFGKPLAAASHRAALKCARLLFRWLVDEKWIKENPFLRVKPIGRVNVGKQQLRVDEARQLNDFLIKQADAGDVWAVAILTQLVLGMRSTEVLTRRVRDLDNGAQALFIERGKTRNARRSLQIRSKDLRRLLMKQASGKQPMDLLFGENRSEPVSYTYLWKRLAKYCAAAGVPKVCPHSLRGLHSTLAIEEGATLGLVASALGHSSFDVTARHYVEPSALINARLRKVQEALALETPEKGTAVKLDAVQELLAKLPKEQIASLLRATLLRKDG